MKPLFYAFTLALIVVLAAQTAIAEFPTDGLVAYYKGENNLEDEFGNADLGGANATVTYVPGVSGQAIKTQTVYVYNDTEFANTGSFNYSIVAWFNGSCNADLGWYGESGVNNAAAGLFCDGTRLGSIHWSDDVYTNTGVVTQGNESKLVVLTYNESGRAAKIYVNGTLISTLAHSTGLSVQVAMFGTSRPNTSNHPAAYYLDEFAFFNKTLSDDEVSGIWNNGAGEFYEKPVVQDVTFTAVDALDDAPISNFSINISGGFNSTTSGTVKFNNATLGNNSLALINITGNFSGASYDESVTIRFIHSSSIQLNLTPVQSWVSFTVINRTDNAPIIFNLSLTGNTNYTRTGSLGHNLTVNVGNYTAQINGTGLGYAIFNYSVVNRLQNVTTQLPNFTILSAPSLAIETEGIIYSIAVPTTDDSQFSNFNLYLNGTTYATTRTSIGSMVYYNVTTVAPSITAISESLTYNWTYTLNSIVRNTESYTLTVAEFIISSCSAPSGAGNYSINLTIYDENNVSIPRIADLEAQINLYQYDRENNIQSNFNLNGQSSYVFCLKPGNVTTQADAIFKYTVDGGFTHRYYINNQTLSNQTLALPVYNFNTTSGLSLLELTIRNQNTFLEFPQLFVSLQRQYLGEGIWRTVQMDQTGEVGVSAFNIYENSQQYRIIIQDNNNTILKQTGQLVFTCDSGICENTILVSPSGTTSSGISVGVATAFNNDTGVLTVAWNEPTGEADAIRVIVTKDTFASSTTICDETFTESSGTTTCNTSAYSKPVTLQVYSQNSPWLFQFTEEIGAATAALKNVIGDGPTALFYSAMIVMMLGIGGARMGVAGAVTGLLLGVSAVFALALTNFLSITVLLVIMVATLVVAAKTRGGRA